MTNINIKNINHLSTGLGAAAAVVGLLSESNSTRRLCYMSAVAVAASGMVAGTLIAVVAQLGKDILSANQDAIREDKKEQVTKKYSDMIKDGLDFAAISIVKLGVIFFLLPLYTRK